jgi:hypothetical protein
MMQRGVQIAPIAVIVIVTGLAPVPKFVEQTQASHGIAAWLMPSIVLSSEPDCAVTVLGRVHEEEWNA